MEKERLDLLLVKRGYFESREKARASIMAGIVYIDNEKEGKCGSRFRVDCKIDIREKLNPYVSRGGLKLEKAIKEFCINLQNKLTMDVGASTGGFTDCMLKNGASMVYSIDVGYGQLAWELRNNPRVKVMERTNIRYVTSSQIDSLVDFASIDVSFISLRKVLPVVCALANENADIVCLIKPQFEAGRDKVGKHGVVRDPKIHEEVVEGIVSFALESNLHVKGISYSPVRGPEGNIEYLLYLSKVDGECSIFALKNVIERVVLYSHEALNK